MEKHFLTYLQESVVKYWDRPALTDYDGNVNLTYGELANEINRLHVLYGLLGLKKGDKVAICSPNCVHWALGFMSITSYEGVVVSILPDFQPESVTALVNHSEARLLLTDNKHWSSLKMDEMPQLETVVSIKDFSLLAAHSEATRQAFEQWNAVYAQEFPDGIGPKNVSYPTDNMDKLCLINYTSGTTSAPKGVMLPYRSLSSNTQYGQDNIATQPGDTLLSMLPLAHMFGLAFELIYPLAGGCHIYFLNRTPSPQILMKALAEVKPYLLITVPLVIEKIFKKTVFPVTEKFWMKVAWYVPGLGRLIKRTICRKLMAAFGGKLRCLIIGGAALSREVESCLKDIRFPYTVGYGMTECGPIIAYSDWRTFKKKSCGRMVDRMEIRIDNPNQKGVGEFMVKGANVMMGYYKNESATKAVMDDGWMRTGDLGIVDRKGNLFIKGRCKSMILGPSGQNIYPEEIEDKLNAQPLVIESVVVQRDTRLVGLVYPDYEEARRSDLNLKEVMEQNLLRLNKQIPPFCRVNKIELVEAEFEKTPKRSIKRFLYS